MKRHSPETLFVSDMDGTLMNHESRVSERTCAIINDLIDNRGLLFTVATARTTATVVSLMSGIHATLPYIILSGAVLWDPVGERLVEPHGLSHEAARQVCDIFERHGVRPMVYSQHGNIIHARHCGPLADYERAFVEARSHTPYKQFFLHDTSYALGDDEVLLIFAMSKSDSLERVYADIISQVDCAPILYHDNTDPELVLLEIYATGCSKASAMMRLSRRLAVDRVVAFGDNINDMAMLRAAHHSVAVSNAVPQLLEIADEVIGPNTDDSVAQYLKRIMNNE